MSIVANFDINLRGNTGSVDAAADKTGEKIAKLRESVDKHGSGIAGRMAELGGKIKGAFAALPGAGVVTAVLGPVVYLGGAIGKAFASSVTGIMSATTAVGAFGAATTVATAGLNLILAAVAATGAAAIGAGMAWTGMGLASMGGIKDAQKAAGQLGMSVEAVQGFAYKSKLEVEDLSGLLLKMERSIGKDAGGGGGGNHNYAAVLGKVSKGGKDTEKALHGAAAAWAKLGLNAEKLRAAKPEEALAMIADGFEGIHNQAERVALAMDVFGKQGAAALKLVKGGSKGIAESMAEARALGIVAGAGEARQVAEASAALADMKRALGGLGKTAAITIAPFVKMIATALTDALKWVNQYRGQIIDFAYTVEFTFKNFSDYAHLYFGKATLWVTQFANATIHFFTDVLPQLFRSFGEMLYTGLTTGFADGFDKAWEKAVADVKASMKRAEGELEGQMRRSLDLEQKQLDDRKAKFLEEKRAALNLDQGQAKGAVGSKDNAAVERGSAEAFKIIAGDQGDKMYQKANEQLTELRKIAEELRKKRAGGHAARVAEAAL